MNIDDFEAKKTSFLKTETPSPMISFLVDERYALAVPYIALAQVEWSGLEDNREAVTLNTGEIIVNVVGKNLRSLFTAISRHLVEMVQVCPAAKYAVEEIVLSDTGDVAKVEGK